LKKEAAEKVSSKEASQILKIVFAAISTALVCAATMLFSVYVPATRGFFNIGESMVFLSAMLFGPFIGAFAGGVGSMLADLLLGYYYYAPATLVIKASEGFIVGFLSRLNPKLSKVKWRVISLTLGLLAGALLITIGSLYYSGEVELTLGQIILPLYIPEVFWVILGFIVAITMILAGLLAEPELGWIMISVITGGFMMVLGYFIYEMYLLGWLFGIEAYAIAEVPVNVGQMTVGSIIAIPTSKVIKKCFKLS
jgi:uncharacterized membrane protein